MLTTSVIVPTVGRKRLLTACLNSVLNQTVSPNEVIVVDNTKNKEMKSVASIMQNKTTIPIRYYHEAIPSASLARNVGIKHAKYSILAFIDDDCFASKKWLAELLSPFQKNSSCVVVKGCNRNALPNNIYSSAEYYNDELFFQTHLLIKNGVMFSQWIDSKNFAIKASLLKKTKVRFSKRYRSFDDLAFSMDLKKKDVLFQFSNKAEVFHHGCTTFLKLFFRNICIGIDRKKIEARVGKKKDSIQLSRIEKDFFLTYRVAKDTENVKQSILRKVLSHKGVTFSFAFTIVSYISEITIKLSYRLTRDSL